MTSKTYKQLLVVALQDLREGRRVICDRLPEIASATDNLEVRLAFHRLIARSTAEMGSFAEMLEEPDGEANLWAGGILDDAGRDVDSTPMGPVRDVALIGAIRKFLAADIVSLETAIALTQHDEKTLGARLRAVQKQASGVDRFLDQQLWKLVTPGE